MNSTYTIVLQDEKELYKLVKIMYGTDGSIMILSPYHPINDAIISLATVNLMAEGVQQIAIKDSLELASFDEDERRIKLSHHVSGMIQVSGEGVTSGFNADGSPKGVAIKSWPLEHPSKGPCFAVAIYGYEKFKKVIVQGKDFVMFDADEFKKIPSFNMVHIEGFVFPALHRRFVRADKNGDPSINIVHPTGNIIPLKVLFPPETCACQSFIGVELFFDIGNENNASPSYILSSSTGNIRLNEKNEMLGDQIMLMFPRQSIVTRTSLNRRVEQMGEL